MKELKKRLVFEIPENKHKEIKMAAAALGMTMKDFIDMSIKYYIEMQKETNNG